MKKLLLVLLMLSALGAARQQERAPELNLQAGEFRPGGPATSAPGWFEAKSVEISPRGKRYVVAVTDGPLDARQRRQMESLGAELTGYLPVYGYKLVVAPGSVPALRALPFVEWIGPLPAHYKIQPQLAPTSQQAAESSIRVVLAAGEPTSRVVQILRGLKRSAAPSGKDGAWRVSATVPRNRLAKVLSELAALPEVQSLERAHPVRALNQDAVWVHQSFVGPSPQETPIYDQGIFGCDQVVGLADTGQDFGTCYFDDTVHGTPPISLCGSVPCPVGAPDPSQRKNLIYYNWSGTPTGDDDTCPTTLLLGSGHGTHVSGAIAGDDVDYADCTTHTGDPRDSGDGQAPGARLVFQEMGDSFEYLNNLSGTVWNIADVAHQSGARIHNISWGGVCHDLLGQCVPGCQLDYDSFARDTDLAMWTYQDLLMVQGAGNGNGICSPPNSVVTPTLAKNSLGVGSVGHATAANNVSSFSSRGPVFDGRLKPTVAAQGEGVISAASDANPTSNNCTLCSLDGTSFSAPTVAGLAALVREYYTAGFYPGGVRNAGAGFSPSGALMKATIIDGAVALGAAAPGPDFDSGYGRVLLGSTLAFSGSSFQLHVTDERDGIVTGGVVTRAFDAASAEPFRATLVWTDYPADLGAATARVNELKLEVIDPAGNTWFQTIDPGTGAPVQTMTPADPHDPLNVEERLVFNAPAAGRWVVRVVGVDVPWGPQPFALVVRGAFTDCPAPGAPAPLTIGTPADDQIDVSWSAVPGAAAYNVYRGFFSCPGGPVVPVATGVTGTSFLDTGVVGGVSYSYYVAATSDAQAFCESAASPCAAAVPTGDCTLAPDFRGITSGASSGESDCSVTLSWDAATPFCGTDVRYNVYRSTSSPFTPGPGNRIARCVGGTSFTDAVDLASGVEHHYVVRAEDASPGHGGPCRGGNEDGNLAEIKVTPDGPAQFGTWSDDAGDTGQAKFLPGPSWAVDATGGDSDPKVYRGASSSLLCTDLVSPVITLADQASGPQLSFSTIHDLDYDDGTIFFPGGSLGVVEIAKGPDFSNWTRVTLDPPGYPAYCELLSNVCPTTQVAGNYFSDVDLVYNTFTAPLTTWAEEDIKLRFHLSGDLYYPGGNWWIDDVQVTQALSPGVCNMLGAGPPPIPDGGSVPGQPLQVSRSGANVTLSWDSTSCPATAVNVYHGAIGDYSNFTGGSCGLAADGSETLSVPDDSWFLVVATDGASTDGSWSRDSAGAELSYAGASAACPAITQHVDNHACP